MNARTIDQHREAVLSLLAPLFRNRATEELPLSSLTTETDSYRGRILAQAVDSPVALPPFDNSQMDGYAVRAEDLAAAAALSPTTLAVAGRIAAGDAGGRLRPGTAAPIMTGAPIPAGADAVVPIEQADPPRFQPPESDGTAASVSFHAPVPVGSFVRITGSDVHQGDRLLDAGTRLGAAQYGVLAGTGLTSATVLRRIRVLLMATGHEIREPGESLAAGQIYDSNTVILGQALRDAGCTVTVAPCRSDDAADLLALLAEAPEVDLIVTVGGVSAGAREVVRDALGPLGVTFQHVAMQPGGPQGLGEIRRPHGGGTVPASTVPVGTVPVSTVPVITFPGNPVSALVSFEVFLRPVLRRLAGIPRPDRELRRAPLAEPVDSPAGKHQLRRGILRPDGALDLVGGASSHLLHAYATATALVHLPVGVGSVAAGEPVDYWSIDD
ncbi:gephyrin-like molybdotransferase Glp [Cryobacterium sp. SO1]|uniref:molybdopterin molybdotransferase MoeA n=1 Tax=Cryobacterium sp. SO1 TaxID=1897061 RepID=UPI00210D77C2|nr:gephyrin-like molybdotransferase Glp [Cryobacterium sp. SO1]